jgi:HEAT repeat protein
MCRILLLSCVLLPSTFSHLSNDEPKFDSVAELLDGLKDSNQKVRADAARFVFRYLLAGKKFDALDAKDLVAALIPLASDTERQVRYEAVVALSEFGGRQGIAEEQKRAVMEVVEKLLKDQDGTIRVKAAEAQAKLDPEKKPDAIAVIESCFKDKDGGVRLDAAAAFRVLAPKRKAEIVPVLQGLLKDSDRCPSAAVILEQLGPLARPAVPTLVEGLKDRDPYNRVSVASALVAIDPKQNTKVIPVLIETLGDDTWRGSAADTLRTIGREAKDAIPRLRELAKAPPDEKDSLQRLARLKAIGALAKIDPEFRDGVDLFTTALKDKDFMVRGHAVYQLGELGTAAKPAVMALVEAAEDDRTGVGVTGVCIALEKIGPGAKEAIPFLEALLENKDESIRENAAKALRAIR